MCNPNCLTFGRENLAPEEVRGKRVIEIGSYDVNGSLRSVIEPMGPAEYVGVDIERGTGVDIVCQAEEVRERFGDESFDVVVSTELIEHVLEWRKVISNMKHICCLGGTVLLTTRSQGFGYHGWPYDFWRFEADDMEAVFSDFNIEQITKDNSEPGVFVKARKPSGFREKDLSSHHLYSIVEERKTLDIEDQTLKAFLERNRERLGKFGQQSLRAKVGKVRRDISWMIKRKKYSDLLAYTSALMSK